jgi:hypothetical protein
MKRRRKGKATEKLIQNTATTSNSIRRSKHSQQQQHRRAAWADVVQAVVTIQKAYRKYRKEQILKGLGVGEDFEKAEKAIIKIQSHVKGFQTRKALEIRKPQLEKHTIRYLEKAKPSRPVKVSKPIKKPYTKIKMENSQKPKSTCRVLSKEVKQSIIPDAISQYSSQHMKKRPLRTETYIVEDPLISRPQTSHISEKETLKTQGQTKEGYEILPNLNCPDIQDATFKIQSAYRGFKARRDLRESEQNLQDLPDLHAADVAAATIKIQSAYKGFRTRQMIKKHNETLPNLNCAKVQDATVKIQSAFRGFKTRKELKTVTGHDLPDLKAADVAAATVKIQAAYKGFRTRQAIKQHQEVLPNLNCAKVQDATIKIQSAYRGFQTRKELKAAGQDLPDLKAADVAAATIKIQAAYKGFRTRQMIQQHKEVLPNLN